MVERGELLEWAEVFGNCYGTPREPVEAALAAGRDVLFDIDWQGTQQLREKARGDMVSIFVLPPSMPRARAAAAHPRARGSSDVIKGRMAKAGDEMSHWAEYDYVDHQRRYRQRLRRACARSWRPSASSASGRPACPPSCAACRRDLSVVTRPVAPARLRWPALIFAQHDVLDLGPLRRGRRLDDSLDRGERSGRVAVVDIALRLLGLRQQRTDRAPWCAPPPAGRRGGPAGTPGVVTRMRPRSSSLLRKPNSHS